MTRLDSRRRWLVCLSLTAAALLAASPGKAQTWQAQTFGDLRVLPEREVAATVLARNESKVAAEVGGRLLRWTAEVGDRVARGTVLAEIDDRDLNLQLARAAAALQSAQARHELARAQLGRTRELVAQGFQSQEAVNLRETEAQALLAEIAGARTQVAAAELQLSRARVRAPFDAVVKARLAQAGEVVQPGTALYLLVERGGAEVGAALAPADTESLRAARGARFESHAGTWTLRLSRVAGTLQTATRTLEVRLSPLSARPELPAAGSDGLLRWQDPRPHVPASAVVRRQAEGRSQLGVFVVEDGRARFVPLPAAQEGRPAPASLPASARIVVQGQSALVAGQALAAPQTASSPAPAASAAR